MSTNPDNINVGFGTPSNAFGDTNPQSVKPTGKLSDRDRDSAVPGSVGTDPAFSSSDRSNVLGSAPGDTFGTHTTGSAGTFGKDSLSSGAFDDARRVGGGAADPISSSGLGGVGEQLGSANDPSFAGHTSQKTGMNKAGGITGTSGLATGSTGLGSEGFTGVGAQAGAHSGTHSGTYDAHDDHVKGDSTMGKIIQKTGQVLKNPKLQAEGQKRREQQGYDGPDVV